MSKLVYGDYYEDRNEFMQCFAEAGSLLGAARLLGVRRKKATFENTLQDCLEKGLIRRKSFDEYVLTVEGREYVNGENNG